MGIFRRKQEISSALSLVAMQPVASVSLEATSVAYRTTIVSSLTSRRTMLDAALQQLIERANVLTDVALRLVETLRSDHKVLIAGNGGSAAESQHFATELVGRFKRERAPYAVLSLNTDTALLTAVANDYGYQDIFARQVLAFGQPGDMLITISTSGESENLLRASQAAQQKAMTVVAITGERSSSLERLAHMTLKVPLIDTALVQELHMVVTHILCDIAETHLSGHINELLQENTGDTYEGDVGTERSRSLNESDSICDSSVSGKAEWQQ